MLTEKVIKGKLTVHSHILDDIICKEEQYFFIGRSLMQFGFYHEWEVGPFQTIKEGLIEFYKLPVYEDFPETTITEGAAHE